VVVKAQLKNNKLNNEKIRTKRKNQTFSKNGLW